MSDWIKDQFEMRRSEWWARMTGQPLPEWQEKALDRYHWDAGRTETTKLGMHVGVDVATGRDRTVIVVGGRGGKADRLSKMAAQLRADNPNAEIIVLGSKLGR